MASSASSASASTGLIGHISLVGPISCNGISGLISQISLVSLCGLSGISGLIGQISLIDLSASSIGFGLIGSSALSASVALLACQRISLDGLVGLSSRQLFCHRLATFLNTATTNHGGSSMQHHNKLPQCNLVLTKLPTRQLIIPPPHCFTCIAREGEDVVVARSCEEKVVVVDCLFWRILQR